VRVRHATSQVTTGSLSFIPGASPQAGIASRRWRLSLGKIMGCKAPKARFISAWGEAPGSKATANKGLKARTIRSFKTSSGGPRLAETPSQDVARCGIRTASGFTLLEVLVALTVFAVGAAVMLSLVSGSLGNIRKVQLRTRTIEHAEAVMELALLDESIQGPTTFAGDFEDGTRWSVLIEEYIPPDVPNMLADGRQVTMPVGLLSYTIEMFSPNSAAMEYSLQTLKLVRATADNNPMRLP